jgi:hypothetical protein
MWSAIFRFVAANISGLAVGYSVRDIAGAITGADDNESEAKESWLTKIIRKLGIPGWFAPVFGLLVIVFMAYRFGLIKRK